MNLRMTTPTREGLGGAHLIVLRCIRNGSASVPQVVQALKQCCSGKAANDLLQRMVDQGLIRRGRGRWHITERGERQIPIATLPPMEPYRPAKAPPVRPGSLDFRSAPSVAAGVTREYVRHV